MIVKPIIILGTPRSGTTILQRCLALHPDLWHLPGESHAILEGPFHPARKGYASNRITADEVDDELAQTLRKGFYHGAINLNEVMSNPQSLFSANSLSTRVLTKLVVSVMGRISWSKKPGKIRFLEKTPKNTLRVPMLTRLFPDAFYVWIKRNAVDNIDSLIAGWYAKDKVGPVAVQRYARAGYPIAGQLHLQDYHSKWWKFALVPGWCDLAGKTVADVAAWQYYQCNHYTWGDLAHLDTSHIFHVQYEEFVQSPVKLVRQIFEWTELPSAPVAEKFAQNLPRVNEAPRGTFGSKQGLRYGDMVYQAIEKLPMIDHLQRQMGY
jgi:hypothetical protein